MTHKKHTMTKFIWSRENSNAIGSCMEDVNAAQMTLEEGNPDEAKRLVKQAVERFIATVKEGVQHVEVVHKVELGHIVMDFYLVDFDHNNVELKLKAWNRNS